MNIKDYEVVKKLHGGNQSKSYLLKNGNVLKIFSMPYHVSEIERYKYFLKYKNDSFVFPLEFISDSDKLYGYIYKYIPGLTLSKCFNSSDLIGLSNNSKPLENDIDFMSDAGITLYDFHDGNIIYNEKKYRVIDPDDYGLYTLDTEITNSYGELYNPKLVVQNKNRSMHRIVICNLFISNLKSVPHTKLILDKISKYKKLEVFPSEIIMSVKDDLDRTFKDDIKTLDYLKRYSR